MADRTEGGLGMTSGMGMGQGTGMDAGIGSRMGSGFDMGHGTGNSKTAERAGTKESRDSSSSSGQGK